MRRFVVLVVAAGLAIGGFAPGGPGVAPAAGADPRPVVLVISPVGAVQPHVPLELRVAVVAQDTSEPMLEATGEVTVHDGVALVGTYPLVLGAATVPEATYPSGVHHLSATYPGDAAHTAGTGSLDLVVPADPVEATGVGVSASTFYPYRDGYRDTVSIRGTRNEPISVSIRVYSSSNKVVRSASIGKGSGAYSYTWNGRSSSGAMLKSGRYKVVQTLRDAYGTTKTWSAFVTISAKRIYTYTVTFEKSISQANRRTASWAGWQFTMPSATVYKAITASVYGHSIQFPGGSFGGHDFATWPSSGDWDPYYVTRDADMGTTVRWYSKGLHPTHDRSGRAVRIYAWANYGGSAAVSKVRVKVTYGVLK